jgi:hypothetical protein
MKGELDPLLPLYGNEDGLHKRSCFKIWGAIALFLTTLELYFSHWPSCYQNTISSELSVETVLKSAPLIGQIHPVLEFLKIDISLDGHNDLPIWIRAFYQNHIYQENFTATKQLYGQVDFPRLRQGGLRGQFWSVYVEWYRSLLDMPKDLIAKINIVPKCLASMKMKFITRFCTTHSSKSISFDV